MTYCLLQTTFFLEYSFAKNIYEVLNTGQSCIITGFPHIGNQQMLNFSHPHPQQFPNQSHMVPTIFQKKFFRFVSKCLKYFAGHFPDYFPNSQMVWEVGNPD